ncbi:MAG: sel1 repeat family protein [Deltaproteobacteria bacterium]|jgi:TPR repeat protein|nr:sel1 repeat family protein [Deltaproteobacteria bacterium]
MESNDDLISLMLLAGGGDRSAQDKLGIKYYKGEIDAFYKDQVIKLLEKNESTKLDDPDAKYRFANKLRKGKGKKKDIVKANVYFKIAAEQGHAGAQFVYGRLLMEKGTKKLSDDSKLVQKNLSNVPLNEWGSNIIRQPSIKYNMPLPFVSGGFTIVSALELLNKSADQGNINALFELGYLYSNHSFIKQDLSKAVDYYHRAGNQGDPRAGLFLDVLFHEFKYVPKDPNKAYKTIARSGSKDYAETLLTLALMYDFGLDIEADLPKAVVLYKKSAKKGNATAQMRLAQLYQDGVGVKLNLQKAISLYKKSVRQGNHYAQLNLGVMYLIGEGIEQNVSKAIELFSKSASQGNDDAMLMFSDLLHNKKYSVSENWNSAAKHLKKEALKQNPFAQGLLSNFYLMGFGVRKNLNKAIELAEKAAAHGIPESEHQLARLQSLKNFTGHVN